MSTPYLPGKFVWFEFLTQDIDKAIKFYDGLFGWHSESVPMGGGEPYPMINNGDQGIGGYRKGPSGVKSHWVSYLSVPDVDAAHSAAVTAGCRIMMAPTDFGQVGRAAAMADPTGASFCVWKGASGDPPDVETTPMGGWCWNELWTSNDRVALAFYETMFGYTHDAMEMGPTTYYVLKAGGRPRAGLCKSVDPKAKSMWLPYVAVPDCDATARKAAALGGEVVTPPRDIPGIGRFGIAVDANGAAVAFITPKSA
jgi:predicted enzyme related to lactoylglutathione lyase